MFANNGARAPARERRAMPREYLRGTEAAHGFAQIYATCHRFMRPTFHTISFCAREKQVAVQNLHTSRNDSLPPAAHA